jgi:hypothetical protein
MVGAQVKRASPRSLKCYSSGVSRAIEGFRQMNITEDGDCTSTALMAEWRMRWREAETMTRIRAFMREKSGV